MQTVKKGIILAGGLGTRLYPLTKVLNKQLMPIYDKPAIYYPLSTLMLAGIREILIISSLDNIGMLKRLFGTGEQLGMSFIYMVQEKPNGLPEAFILGEDFIANEPVAMILGDNFFHGHKLSEVVFDKAQHFKGAHLFTYQVENPQRYGIAVVDENNQVIDVEEKPKDPKSKRAITGLYYFDHTVSNRARKLKPSSRGELEIVDLIKNYLEEQLVFSTHLGRGYVWFDTGTFKSLLSASQYVELIQTRQNTAIGAPEEIALNMGFLTQTQFKESLNFLPESSYKTYLKSLLL